MPQPVDLIAIAEMVQSSELLRRCLYGLGAPCGILDLDVHLVLPGFAVTVTSFNPEFGWGSHGNAPHGGAVVAPVDFCLVVAGGRVRVFVFKGHHAARD